MFFFSCFRRTRPRHQVEMCKVDLCEDGVSYDFQVVILRPVTYIDILYLMKIFLRGQKQSYKQVFFFILLGVAEAAARAAASKKLVSFNACSCCLSRQSLFLFLFLGSVLLGQRLCSCRPTKSGSHGNSLAPHQQPPAPTCFTYHLSFISSHH